MTTNVKSLPSITAAKQELRKRVNSLSNIVTWRIGMLISCTRVCSVNVPVGKGLLYRTEQYALSQALVVAVVELVCTNVLNIPPRQRESQVSCYFEGQHVHFSAFPLVRLKHALRKSMPIIHTCSILKLTLRWNRPFRKTKFKVGNKPSLYGN